MKKIAVIGAGISGLAIARCLQKEADVTVFEKDSRPGGLVKCDRIDGNLYHMVGGHVFNSKRQDVLEWFWSLFDRETEFTAATRNAVIHINKIIGYPIENHIYQLNEELARKIVSDLLKINHNIDNSSNNFEEFLLKRFGKTLYDLYFKPYNEKVWKRDLCNVPLSWLEGKLQMPTVDEIFLANILKKEEKEMVHSSFYYPKFNGSQFLADRMSKGINIIYNSDISSIHFSEAVQMWKINNDNFDYIIFTGNLKDVTSILNISDIDKYLDSISQLEFHGTTSVLCKVDASPYSWVYLPKKEQAAHRIICTGNFSSTNSSENINTATIEFTDMIDKETILKNLQTLPFSPQYITHRYTKFTYPIQNPDTRKMIGDLKIDLKLHKFYLLGRFAEWEYYNMDAAIGAAIDLANELKREISFI